MTLYVAIIGLGTLAGILFNVLFNKRLVFKIIGIAVTLLTGTFACCVVLYPYFFFSSYNNLIIKLTLSAVLLVVIYVSARMIVNAVTSIRKDKAAEAAKAAEKEREEVSVLSHALKSRVKDMITADKAVPAQRVSIADNRYVADKAPAGQAAASGIDQQPAGKQTFTETLKEADDKIVSEPKEFIEQGGPTRERSIAITFGRTAEVTIGQSAPVSKPEEQPVQAETKAAEASASESKLDVVYEQPEQGEKAEEEQSTADATPKPDVEYEQPVEAAEEQEQAALQDAAETAHDIQSGEAAEAAADKPVMDMDIDSQEAGEPAEAIAEQSAAQPEAAAVSETEQAAAVQQEDFKAAGEETALVQIVTPEPAPADDVQSAPVAEPVPEPVQNAAPSDKYAALMAKAGELMEEAKYVYAAELLQMCSDRSEDVGLKKSADIMIIECFALSNQNSEAKRRWIEFLNKAYPLDEDDKIKLKKVMSSL